jgi:Tol biopolymer transport system component
MKRRWSSAAGIVLCMLAALVASVVAVPAAAADPGVAGSAPAAIVFVRGQGHPFNGEIWTMGRHGGNQVRLTRSDVADYEPEWSPDGTTIAWTRYSSSDFGPSDVWIMNPDGSDPHNVTNHQDDVGGPSWSPDGTRIAYEWDSHIWVIGADGTGDHDISPAGSLDHDPAWSPDGTQIAFISGSDVFVMNADGSDRRQVTETVGILERDPAWSPDGSRIAVSGYHTRSSWHVDVMRSDGAAHHIAVDMESLQPAWSPDGSKLAFYGCGDLGCRLYRSSVRGRHVNPLGRRDGFSDESPDFRQVLPVS